MAAEAGIQASSADPAPAIPRDYNFADDLFRRVRDRGWSEKPAYIDPRGAWTYGELVSRAELFGHVLRSLGVDREQRILMCLTDTIDWPIVFLGAIKAGVVPVPVNTLMTEDDYRFMLADSRAKALVVSDALFPKFQKMNERLANVIDDSGELERVIVCRPDFVVPTNDCVGRAPRRFSTLSFERLMEESLERTQHLPAKNWQYSAPTTCDDIAFWLYTSGSTGKPKAAVHTHADLRLTNDLYAAPILGITEKDVCFSVAKLFFAYGLGNAMTFPLSAGATTVLLPDRPTPDSVAEILKKHQVTVFYAVPTFYAAFLANPNAPLREELKLRVCVSAGEALPPDIGRRWKERYGVDILDGLGSTEMLHIFLSNAPGDVKYGTSGKPVPGYDIRLVDDEGEVITAPNEMGELQVRGPTAAVMYWNNREQSRATFLGEWTRSGDKYIRDEQGYYVYCGRRDDMLKVGGIYVSPFEVEGALQSHPEVLEAAVVAWPDDDQLIKPKAFVVLKTAGAACEALALSLQEHCKQKLAPYKYPRWIEFRADLPKTATGKIQRFRLRAEIDR